MALERRAALGRGPWNDMSKGREVGSARSLWWLEPWVWRQSRQKSGRLSQKGSKGPFKNTKTAEVTAPGKLKGQVDDS